MSDLPHSQEDAFGMPPDAARPRYYIDLYDGTTLSEDETGVEVESVQAARDHAVRVIAEIIQDGHPDEVSRTLVARVRDAQGRPVLQAALTLMLERL